MIGADALVKCLEQEGVEVVFGYPGVAIAPFFDSILNTKIRTILVRQEQNAAHAASGYARISGKAGVCAVTSGPGAENLITGIATAFADSIPLICITGQVDSRLMGSDVFQEADISGAVESFVKYSYIVRDAEDIPRIMKEAFMIAQTGRRGPVLIDIPQDIQQQEIRRFVYPDTVHLRTYKPTVEGHAVQISKVVRGLSKAKRPILCVGGGVFLSNAVKEVRAFAQDYRVPVVSTMMGLSVMPTDDPMYFGMVGNNGQKYGNRAMNEADMIIMAGCRVADRSISQPDLITENKILVHIDVDPAEIGKNAGPSIPLVGDLRHVFRALNTAMQKENARVPDEDWLKLLESYRKEQRSALHKRYEAEAAAVSPGLFIHNLSLAMKEDAIYVADVGQNQLWSCAHFVVRANRFLTSGGMGTMGYAVPAAMGAKIASPGRQVVAVCGDGGFQMTMMELATMMQYGIQAKVVVLKNRTLGLVYQYQHLTYHDRFSVTDLGEYPHLNHLAAAYDMDYLKLEQSKDMEETIRAFLKDRRSVLLEVRVDPSEIA